MAATQQRQTAGYRIFDIGGYRVEILKRAGSPTYWQYRVWQHDGAMWQIFEDGMVGSRDEAACVAGMVIADHRREQ